MCARRRHVDGDHVAEHVHRANRAGIEESSRQDICRLLRSRRLRPRITLMAHAGQRAIQFEPHPARRGRRLHLDCDWLTHADHTSWHAFVGIDRHGYG